MQCVTQTAVIQIKVTLYIKLVQMILSNTKINVNLSGTWSNSLEKSATSHYDTLPLPLPARPKRDG